MATPTTPPVTNILYILGKYPARSETFIQRELEELQRRGITLRVLRLRRGGRDAGGHAPLWSIPWLPVRIGLLCGHPLLAARLLRRGFRRCGASWRNRLYWLYAWPTVVAAVARLRAAPPSRIHAHWATVPGVAGCCIAAELQVPFSFTTHAFDLFTPQSCFAAIAGDADHIVTVSRYNRDWIAQHHGNDIAALVRVSYNGLPDTLLHGATPEPRRDSTTVVAACRLVPKKGLDTLIRAVDLITGIDGLRLCIYGDGPEARPLKRLARAGERPCAIRFPGWRRAEQMPPVYARAALFILPCRVTRNGDRDSMPVALLEAMACGTPVITSPVAGIPELIEHGVNGWLLASETPAALAGAITTLLRDHGLREQLGNAARQTVRSRFRLADTIQPLLEVLQS